MDVRKFGLKLMSVLLSLSLVVTLLPTNNILATSTDGRINVQADEAGVFELAQAQFAAKGVNVELVYNETSIADDIVVEINGADVTYGEEGYGISVDGDIVTVTAHTNTGAFYGLQNVLQQLEQKSTVSNVAATQPYKATRALFVDTARKYFGISWFEEIIREMSWNGMNTLYISFSNDEGFRFLLDDMSLSFDDGSGNTVTYNHEFMAHLVDNPETVADSAFLTERNANATDEGSSRVVTNYDNNKYYTQDDMERILAYAKAYGINVIPEFNSPGHFGQVMWYFPEYRIQGTWYSDGQPHYGLDLTNTEAFNFGTALVKKYIDFFAEQGCTNFCVGGDEYSQGNATNQQVATYTNGLVEYAESKDMKAYAWNDGQAAANGLLNNTAIVNAWNGTSSYKLVNFDSGYLYYVLKESYWKPDAQILFESWSPNVYSSGTDLSSNIQGASLAIWCDVPNKETPEYVLESMIPNIQAFGYKMWNYSETATASLTDEYDSYSDFAAAVTDAPDVAEVTVLNTVDYDTSALSVVDVDTLPVPSIGSGYQLVTFNTPSVSASDGWYSADYTGSNVIDGNTGTSCWMGANQEVGDYIRVDLGSLQTVNTITVTSPSGSGDICTNADVQVSVDGETWESIGIHNDSSTNTLTSEHTINSEIRYIQVVITQAQPLWWSLAEISWSPKASYDTTIADGTYIIVNGTNKAMTNTVSGDGFANQQVTINGNIATPLDEVYEWTFAKQSDGTYYITDSNGNYLNINSDGITTSSTAQNITATISGGKVQLSNGSNAINFYAGHNPQIFARWTTDTSDSNNMQTLYKKYDDGLSTIALYNAIVKAAGYSNTDSRYDSDAFTALQTVLTESATLYQSASEENTTVTQETVDAQTEKLLNAIAALELTDTTISYIDIPMQILDFRADGVMFEYAQNTAGAGLYELLTDEKFGNLTYANETVAMPGELGDRLTEDEWHISDTEPMGWYENCKRTGLVEDYLVNGAPVYKEVTVDYVAKLIAKGYFADLSSSVTNWNSNISTKVDALYAGYDADTDTNSNLGTWANTLTKTSTQANGGDMTWSSITTCYDLAYYVLNNMWRSTQTADGVNTYNRTVPERTTLRMLLDSDGYYRLDSTKEISYVDNYIYNTDFTTENTAETKFTPINDLGYESSDNYGDTTDTTTGVNFHYTLHANGSFVYNADDNLYFYFDGDDDVYFYINGQLVMDIGGAHSHCDDELYLNEIAPELGLVDGGIYTFDMFYAERHTTQANLEFKTNIKIMDTMSTTSKGQYNASTGEVIPYGAIVDEGTTVAYSFELLNMRSVNVTDITFIDETLGTNISKNNITLYDASLTNGATTSITDIIVYYHTYDRPAPSEPGTLNSEKPEDKTVAEITEMINAANANGYSSLESGSYKVTITSDEELKALLALGIPIDTQIRVYGVKRNVTEHDRPYINTVQSHAYYTSNNKRIALNGVASQKLTVLNSFKTPTEKEQVVVDFGKDLDILIENINKSFDLNNNVTATFYGIINNGSHNQIRTDVSTGIITDKNTAYESLNGYGNYYIKDNSIRFELNKMLSDVEKVYAVYKISDSSLIGTNYETYFVLVEVDIVPATMVYYETDFADVFTFTVPETDTQGWITKIEADDTTDTLQDDGTVGVNQTYGYDSTYDDDALLSDGSSYYVEGQGRTKTITTFSFTGTGFDLISRTGAQQGAIRVDVYSDEAMTTRVKAVTVINKSESDLELYQIPVVSINGLEHGTYYVKVGVNASYDSDGNGTIDSDVALDRGNQFYFDAIRVYDPINVDASTDSADIAKLVYATDGELKADITEVREILLDTTTYSNGVTGMLFIDQTQTGAELGTYTAIGPNNEVYLQPGNAIAFKVSASGVLGGIDIGAKSADGKPVRLQVTIANASTNATVTNTLIKDINSSTALFYDLLEDATDKDINNYLDANGEAYVVITNSGSEGSILSITDIKVGYNDVPAANLFLADDEVITYARNILREPDYDIHNAELSSSSYRIFNKIEMTVVTTTDVEKLVVNNKYGMKLYTETSYVINDEGMKVWTVKFRSILLGNQTFKVTGYGADETTGTSATVSARIKLF